MANQEIENQEQDLETRENESEEKVTESADSEHTEAAGSEPATEPTEPAEDQSEKPSQLSVWKTGLSALAMSAVLNVIIFIFGGIFGIDFQVPVQFGSAETTELLIPNVLVATVAPILTAIILMSILTSTTQNPKKPFVWLAVIVLILSFAMPLLTPLTLGVRVSFLLMHLAAGLPVILKFGRL